MTVGINDLKPGVIYRVVQCKHLGKGNEFTGSYVLGLAPMPNGGYDPEDDRRADCIVGMHLAFDWSNPETRNRSSRRNSEYLWFTDEDANAEFEELEIEEIP